MKDLAPQMRRQQEKEMALDVQIDHVFTLTTGVLIGLVIAMIAGSI